MLSNPVEVGQVYIAADGGHYGHYITDVTTYAFVNDVVTIPFTQTHGFLKEKEGNRIDAFKLSYRYSLADPVPDWVKNCLDIFKK